MKERLDKAWEEFLQGRRDCFHQHPVLDAITEELHRLSGTVSAKVKVVLCDTNVPGHIVPEEPTTYSRWGREVLLEFSPILARFWYLSQGPSYFTPALCVDESKHNPTSVERKATYGSWYSSTIGHLNDLCDTYSRLRQNSQWYKILLDSRQEWSKSRHSGHQNLCNDYRAADSWGTETMEGMTQPAIPESMTSLWQTIERSSTHLMHKTNQKMTSISRW